MLRILLSCLLLLILPASAQIIPNDPLASYDASRRLSWAQGSQWQANAYQYNVAVTFADTSLWQGQYGPMLTESGWASIRLNYAWTMKTIASNIKVAVIDETGFDLSHPDLAANILLSTNILGTPVTAGNHGTGVASIIGAVGNNGIGLAGVCWSVPLILIQASHRLPSGGGAPTMAAAIDFAVDNGARVICIPSTTSGHIAVSNAIVRAGTSNVLFCVAALNQPLDHDVVTDYPTSWRFSHVLTITCSMRSGVLVPGGAGYGNETVFCSVPARRVPVATVGGYGFDTGTSFACAYTAGVAALAWSVNPNTSWQTIKIKLGQVTQGPPDVMAGTITGGLLNAPAAVYYWP